MIHREPVLQKVRIVASTLAVGGSLLYPNVMSVLTLPILALVVVSVGIPHGALDHIIGQKLLHRYDFKSVRLLFYASYLSFAAVMGGLWAFSPQLAFLLFVTCAMYHFGEADLKQLPGTYSLKNLLFWSRGVMVMGLLIFGQPSITDPLIRDISGLSLSIIPLSPENLRILGVVSGLQYLLFLAGYTYGYSVEGKTALNLVGDALLLLVLFLTVHSLLAFAIYFGLWHSSIHLIRIRRFFEKYEKSLDIKNFPKKASLFTLPILLVLAVALFMSPASLYDARAITILFVIISIITLPHVFLVRWMYGTLDY